MCFERSWADNNDAYWLISYFLTIRSDEVDIRGTNVQILFSEAVGIEANLSGSERNGVSRPSLHIINW